MRYWLNVPPTKGKQATQAGCVYSHAHHLWYVEEPFLPRYTLTDFMAWDPVRHDDVAMQQKEQIEAAKHRRKKRAERERKNQERRARKVGVRCVVTRTQANR